jgi:hypothetical protein
MIMDATERQRILWERLTANQQRLARQRYLQRLPPALASYLDACPIILTPQFDALIPYFRISPDGIGTPPYRPDGYTFTEYSWPDQALAAPVRLSPADDHLLSYFWPSGGNPIYRVEFGWVRHHLAELWPHSPQELGAMTIDHTKGFVISNYSGYLNHDPNPEEVVFEVAVWSDDVARE